MEPGLSPCPRPGKGQGGSEIFLKSGSEIFLKRGLILGGKNAIMCNCMKITEEEVP